MENLELPQSGWANLNEIYFLGTSMIQILTVNEILKLIQLK
jgi:hypothetical protein